MIQIRKSPTADSRTCDYTQVSQQQLLNASVQHIADVGRGLAFFSAMLAEAAVTHDEDKITDIASFYADFKVAFATTGWWDRHRTITRHHLLHADGVPADVNLIDVLELIVDCVMAGKARAGEVYPIELDPAVLHRAFLNTVALMKRNVEVIDMTPPGGDDVLDG
jgi:hypothetical protein